MVSRTLVLLVTIIFGQTMWAQEFHVIASRRAVVRVLPDTSSADVTRLERGDAAGCFTDPTTGQPEQENRLYHIRLVDGRIGWVSRYTVRPHPGPVPGPTVPPNQTPLEAQSRAFHLNVGAPRSYSELINEGYVVGYDHRLKIPAWVQYRITRQQLAIDRPRSNAFAEDERTPQETRPTLIDYEEARSWDLWTTLGLQPPAPANSPNYARGHLAPARDLARTADIEESSYLLTNMAPQVHNAFNNGTWSALEARVRRWGTARGDLTIIAGPVFSSTTRRHTPPVGEQDRLDAAADLLVLAQPPTARQVIYNVVGQREVAVPTAFFKVVVDYQDPQNPDVLAFLIPHHAERGRDLQNLLVSVNDIERLTGLDLLTSLPDAIENQVEAVRANALW